MKKTYKVLETLFAKLSKIIIVLSATILDYKFSYQRAHTDKWDYIDLFTSVIPPPDALIGPGSDALIGAGSDALIGAGTDAMIGAGLNVKNRKKKTV